MYIHTHTHYQSRKSVWTCLWTWRRGGCSRFNSLGVSTLMTGQPPPNQPTLRFISVNSRPYFWGKPMGCLGFHMPFIRPYYFIFGGVHWGERNFCRDPILGVWRFWVWRWTSSLRSWVCQAKTSLETCASSGHHLQGGPDFHQVFQWVIKTPFVGGKIPIGPFSAIDL